MRSLGIVVAMVTQLLVAGCAGPGAKDRAVLEGRWRNVSNKIYFSNGTSSTAAPMRCEIEFSKNRAISECMTSSGTARIVYAYRLSAPSRYESEVLENKNFPQYVGMRVPTDFRVENGILFTTSFPPAPKEGQSNYPIKIESRWARE